MWDWVGHDVVKSLGKVVSCAVAIGFGLTLLAVTLDGSIAQAGEREIKRGKVIWNNKSNCKNCHGWAGDGRAHPRSPPGPSLRISELDRESMREVIACGMPGTAMPHHDRHAYTDDRCYGLTKDDLEKEMMPKMGNKPIRPTEIEMVIDYIEARIKGRGKVTLEECEEYFNRVGAKGCAKLPKLADVTN
ncbi:MAG TPA: c-type cytochrome [Alphaproteobacteria bacterium]|jgi:mono/diheme cytochrome c family protein|nr:c-type cytochrome [Alphaproteobacteria bacterium]HIA21797.1 c-type cytochrome [Alphaproteobacteria bacterium]HIB56795.1 c-type cytochrome [Alphaproteobacteria bacterium]HIN91994.1 c-type cytochrome [Alphaproteobacteria bacterium]HIO02408.1 c-type cytochrome [Alphaproteobacteria bacterium]